MLGRHGEACRLHRGDGSSGARKLKTLPKYEDLLPFCGKIVGVVDMWNLTPADAKKLQKQL